MEDFSTEKRQNVLLHRVGGKFNCRRAYHTDIDARAFYFYPANFSQKVILSHDFNNNFILQWLNYFILTQNILLYDSGSHHFIKNIPFD